jgi:hypothetical protein
MPLCILIFEPPEAQSQVGAALRYIQNSARIILQVKVIAEKSRERDIGKIWVFFCKTIANGD